MRQDKPQKMPQGEKRSTEVTEKGSQQREERTEILAPDSTDHPIL